MANILKDHEFAFREPGRYRAASFAPEFDDQGNFRLKAQVKINDGPIVTEFSAWISLNYLTRVYAEKRPEGGLELSRSGWLRSEEKLNKLGFFNRLVEKIGPRHLSDTKRLLIRLDMQDTLSHTANQIQELMGWSPVDKSRIDYVAKGQEDNMYD